MIHANQEPCFVYVDDQHVDTVFYPEGTSYEKIANDLWKLDGYVDVTVELKWRKEVAR